MKRLTEQQKELVASLTLKEFWEAKFMQVGALLDECKIDARQLVSPFRLPDFPLLEEPQTAYYEAREALQRLSGLEQTHYFFGFLYSVEARLLEQIDHLRRMGLYEYVSSDHPSVSQALFVYRIPIDELNTYYFFAQKHSELLEDPDEIIEAFYKYLEHPYVMTSTKILEDETELRGYFALPANIAKHKHKVYDFIPKLFHFALAKMLGQEVDGTFTVSFGVREYSLACVASGELDDYLWLFFDGYKKQ